ncbi:DUF6065 family protein [Xenorhabdus khoisanae]|nr:DUF6065 family protein [Xenorhabdus khoisanae]
MTKNINFFKAWPESPDPIKANIAITGEIPSRAHQFCEPFLVANSMGFLIYPPMNFDLMWDGYKIYFQPEGMDEWIIIDKLYLPDSVDIWQKVMPESHSKYLPAFIEAFPEKGVIQVWTGYFVSTSCGESLWIRAPINRPSNINYRVMEGIIESDWWAGPLFTNFEMMRSDVPISFKKTEPILQVFTIPKEYHRNFKRNNFSVSQLDKDTSSEFLERILSTSTRRNTEKPGSYRRLARKNNEA